MKYVEHFPLEICSIKLKLGFKRTDIKTQIDLNINQTTQIMTLCYCSNTEATK